MPDAELYMGRYFMPAHRFYNAKNNLQIKCKSK